MTCIGYDAEFVDVLVRNMPAWVIFDKEMKVKRREAKAKRKAKAKVRASKTDAERTHTPVYEVESYTDSKKPRTLKPAP